MVSVPEYGLIRRYLHQISLADWLLSAVTVAVVCWNELPHVLSAPPVQSYIPNISRTITRINTSNQEVGVFLSCLLMVFVIYTYLPIVYPDILRVNFQHKDLGYVRILLTIFLSIQSITLFLSVNQHRSQVFIFREYSLLFGVILISNIPFHMYLIRVLNKGDPTTKKSPVIGLFVKAITDPGKEYSQMKNTTFSKIPYLSQLTKAMVYIASASLFLFFGLFLSLFVPILNHYYPLLEFFTVGSLSYRYILSQTSSIKFPAKIDVLGYWSNTLSLGEVEEGFYKQIRLLIHSGPLGICGPGVLFIVSLLYSLVFLVTGYSNGGVNEWVANINTELFFFESSTNDFFDKPTSDNFIDSLIHLKSLFVSASQNGATLFIIAQYSLWFWYHQIRRTPAVLLTQKSNSGHPLPISAELIRSIPTRPPFYFLPIAIVGMPWIYGLSVYSPLYLSKYAGQTRVILQTISSVIWVLGIFMMVFSIWTTFYKDAQPPTSVTRELLLPFGVLSFTFFCFISMVAQNLDGSPVFILFLFVCILFYMWKYGSSWKKDEKVKYKLWNTHTLTSCLFLLISFPISFGYYFGQAGAFFGLIFGSLISGLLLTWVTAFKYAKNTS